MENHPLFLKLSHFLSSSFSSCHFTDVAEPSIPIPLQNRRSSSPQNGRLEPSTNKDKFQSVSVYIQSSSSNSGWFSSGDEKIPENDPFLSFSSCSADSFRRGTATRREMEIIDELGLGQRTRSSLSSSALITGAFSDRVGGGGGSSRRSLPPPPKTAHTYRPKDTRKTELGPSDGMSARIYYSGAVERSGSSRARRKVVKSRRKASGGGKLIEESLAVEKKSSDPRGDFRASMVEMIVEKQLFGARDLERLLICFLSLNSAIYHAIIFEVFSEICETLFVF